MYDSDEVGAKSYSDLPQFFNVSLTIEPRVGSCNPSYVTIRGNNQTQTIEINFNGIRSIVNIIELYSNVELNSRKNIIDKLSSFQTYEQLMFTMEALTNDDFKPGSVSFMYRNMGKTLVRLKNDLAFGLCQYFQKISSNYEFSYNQMEELINVESTNLVNLLLTYAWKTNFEQLN